MQKRKNLTLIIGLISLLVALPLSVLLMSQNNVGETRTKAGSSNAVLSFFPENPPLPVANNSPIEIRVLLNTNRFPIGSIDLIISYDPNFLSITDINIVPGSIYPSYPGRSVDSTEKVIAIASDGKFSGSGTFATLRFTTIKPGATTLSFQKVFSEGITFTTSNTTLVIR